MFLDQVSDGQSIDIAIYTYGDTGEGAGHHICGQREVGR
jgi:hypothetical protein